MRLRLGDLLMGAGMCLATKHERDGGGVVKTERVLIEANVPDRQGTVFTEEALQKMAVEMAGQLPLPVFKDPGSPELAKFKIVAVRYEEGKLIATVEA